MPLYIWGLGAVLFIRLPKLDRLPIDVLDVKKSAVTKSGKTFLNIINSGTMEKKFSFFEVRDDLNNILEELSKGKDVIYLVVGIDDLGIFNSSNIKEIVTFREIEYFLEGIRDSKIRDDLEPLKAKNYKMIDIAQEIEKEYKNDNKILGKQRESILLPLVNEFFDYIESIKSKGKEPTNKKLEKVLSTKELVYAFLKNGRISTDLEHSAFKVLFEENKFYVSNNHSNMYAPITSSLFGFIESSNQNNLDAIEYISYLIEMLGNEEETDIEDILPWSKKMKEMFGYGTY